MVGARVQTGVALVPPWPPKAGRLVGQATMYVGSPRLDQVLAMFAADRLQERQCQTPPGYFNEGKSMSMPPHKLWKYFAHGPWQQTKLGKYCSQIEQVLIDSVTSIFCMANSAAAAAAAEIVEALAATSWISGLHSRQYQYCGSWWLG